MTPDIPPRFAVLTLTYDEKRLGIHILCTTDIACHLFCRISTEPPRKHRIPVIVRGYPIRDDYRWCFTVYHDNEQEEDGDTYIHTFIKVPWPHCETRYFYFWRTVAGIVSPSTSALFEKHRIVPEWWLILTEPWSAYASPPEFTLLLTEPWSAYASPPEFTLVLTEPWSA